MAAYALAMTVANVLVSIFGPVITPLNSFILIGFDLTMRDWLNVRIKNSEMFALIVFSGLLTFVFAPSSQIIAIASACSFSLAAIVDWGVFKTVKGSWTTRSNASNAAGAAVDSMVFPTIAFGAIMPGVVAAQFAAKVVGGAIWSVIFRQFIAHENKAA